MINGYIPYYGNGYFYWNPFIPENCEKPPTVYAVLNSIVNGKIENKENYHKIADLPRLGRETIFNFNYPLSSHVSRETFETNILNHYLMRRIGTETVTAFRINLNAKLNEIMPIYNKMFDALDGWKIFEDGDVTTRTGTDSTVTNSTNNRNTDSNNTRNSTNSVNGTNSSESSSNIINTSKNSLENNSTTNTTSTSDRRMSNTPQNNLQNVKDGKYVTQYNYDTTTSSGSDSSTSTGNSSSTESNNSANSGTNSETTTLKDSDVEKIVEEIINKINENKNYNEKIVHSPENKIEIMKAFQQDLQSIYTLIYKDLDCLFYGLV